MNGFAKENWNGENAFDLCVHYGHGICRRFVFRHFGDLYYIMIAIAGIGCVGGFIAFAIMSEKGRSNKMGLYMGIFNLSVVLPQLVAGSFKMGEVVNAASDKSVVFLICAVTLAISGVLWLL